MPRSPSISRRCLPLGVAIPYLLLSACVVGPDFEAPPVAVRDAWISPVSTAEVDAAWWRKLNDPVLIELVDAAIANNKDLDEAAVRL